MKKSVPSQVFCFVLFLCLVMCGIAPAEEVSVIDEDLALKYPIMHPDRQTLRRWMDQYNTAPKAHIDPEIAADLSDAELRGRSSSVNLLSHLKYTPSERNQGNCGDCWAWAGTGVMEIALHVQNNLKDRLSEQYFNSCEMWNSFGFSCCGGHPDGFCGLLPADRICNSMVQHQCLLPGRDRQLLLWREWRGPPGDGPLCHVL